LETLENERQIIGADDWLNGEEAGVVGTLLPLPSLRMP
jgi:hypothetical protein